MKYKYIIWDWNGTLFDDVSVCINAMNDVLRERGVDNTLTYDYYRECFCFPVSEYYKKIGFDFSRDSFDFLAKLYMKKYTDMQSSVTLGKKARETLERLNSRGAVQNVISASETGILLEQIRAFDIEKYFTSILGTDNIYAVSKVDIAKSWMKEVGADKRETVFIGDTVHDYETAASVGCQALLVSCGHQSKAVLGKTGTLVFDSLENVCDCILGE